MAVTIDIPGVGNVEAVNAAQDSTLQEILKALKKGGGGGGAGGAGAGGPGGAAPQAQKKIEDLGDGAKDAAKDVTGLGKAAVHVEQIMQNLVLGGLSAMASGAVNFGKELLMGGNRLTDLASAVPLVGDYLGALASVLDSQVDTFRQLSATGASFGNNMFEMSRVAATSGMALERFAGFVGEHAKTMALFGASTTEGVKRFAVLSKGLRTGRIGEQLMAMGYSMDGINEGLVNYTEEMARSGRLEGMSNSQLISGAQNYLQEMDKLAKVTGRNREELERARQGLLDDARTRMHANTLEGDARENFLNNMTMLNTTMPGMAGALDDLRDGVAQTDEGIALVNILGDEAYEIAEKLANGADPAEFQNALAAAGPRIEEFVGSSDPDAIAAFLTSIKDTQPALYSVLSAGAEINRLTQKNNEITEEEQRRRENLTSFMTGLEQAIEGFRAKLKEYFLDSPVFEQIMGMFEDLTGPGDGLNALFEKMKPTLDSLMESLSGFLTAFMNDPTKALEDLGASVMGWIGDGLKSLFSSMLPAMGPTIAKAILGVIIGLALGVIAGPFTLIGAALMGIFGVDFIMGLLGGAWDMIKGMFVWIADGFSMLWEGIQPVISFLSDTVMTVFGHIGDAFSAIWEFVQPAVETIWNVFSTMFGWIGDTFGWIWDKVKGPINFIYDTLSGMFGWVGDTAGWIYGKIKALNPFSWFGSDDDEDEAEEQIAQRQTEETGVVAQRPDTAEATPFNTPTTVPDTARMMAEFTPEELSTVGDAMTNVASNVGELSTQLGDIRNFTQNQNRTNDLIIALNTTMTQVAELLEENNDLTKGTRNAVQANGDMMSG